uniref:CCD97-like C-terminal domain-containing protein n=1 Tax=Gossypium raimondii TaxID=29730 RepID=A0A0D2PEP1_GOSRA|nr:hypothetical protein B456_004G191100 [Gossypium raimondii]
MERKVSEEAMETITERLSALDNLYFPRALQSSASDPSNRKSILHDLLSRDVPVFLERYGSQLTSDELHEFDALNDDYEVNWHLKHLRSKMSPTSEELKLRSVTVKNRRRAYLNKLVCDGHYFSEDAMREREPYLHHEYLGRFQDLSGRSMARPGERWSETLMRRCEEARCFWTILGMTLLLLLQLWSNTKKHLLQKKCKKGWISSPTSCSRSFSLVKIMSI